MMNIKKKKNHGVDVWSKLIYWWLQTRITRPHSYHVMLTEACWLKLDTVFMTTNHKPLTYYDSHLFWDDHQTSLCHHLLSLDQVWFDLLSLDGKIVIVEAQFHCQRILLIRLVLSEYKMKLFPSSLSHPETFIRLSRSVFPRINSYWINFLKEWGKWY